MSDKVDGNVLKLPKYLDIYEAANGPKTAQGLYKEWGFFTDDEGRVIAQLVDLVLNEEQAQNATGSSSEPHSMINDTPKQKAVVLIIGTDHEEDLPPPSSEVPQEMFFSDIDYYTTESWVKKQEKRVQSIFTQQNWKHSNGTEAGIVKMSDLPEPSKNMIRNNLQGYPCVKSRWYIRKPIHDGTLVDDVTIVDTKVLANDLREFLKNNFISLAKFAKDYLKRRQGTLSDLLNHPKSWAELSSKGRENYVKLMEFLSASELTALVPQLHRKEKCPVSDLESSKWQKSSDVISSSLAATNLMSGTDCINYHSNEQDITPCGKKLGLQSTVKAASKPPPYDIAGESFIPIICPYNGCDATLFDEASYTLHKKHHAGMQQKKIVATVDIVTSEELANKNLELDQLKPEADDPNGAADITSRKYVCGSCWRGFKSRQHLTKHLSHAHCVGGQYLRDGFTCHVCSKVVKNISTLKVHMRSHTNCRPFKCNQCHLGFKTKANLQRHMRIHTGEKPYACTYCPSKFTEATALITHVRTHTGERPLKCKFCDRRFAQYTPLKQHMLIHENKRPHLCEKCGKSFRQKTNLQVHVKRHRGVKKFNCTKCSMAFITKSDFNRHSLKHTGEKPHQCRLCHKSFTRTLYLADHMKALNRPTAPECAVCYKKFCNDNALKKHAKMHKTTLEMNDSKFNEGLAKNKVVNPPLTEAFATLDDPDGNNILLFTTKISGNSEKQYYITPVQTFESSPGVLGEDASINNYPSVVLTPEEEDQRIQFTASESSFFLQGIGLTDQQVSMVGSNSELLLAADPNMLTTIRGVNLPISLTTHGSAAIKEGSDPNMQCAVAKTPDDSLIIQDNLEISGLLEERMKLDPCQIVVQNSQDAEGNVIITIPDQSQLTSSGGRGSISDAELMDTRSSMPGMPETADVNSDGATYIIVNTE